MIMFLLSGAQWDRTVATGTEAAPRANSVPRRWGLLGLALVLTLAVGAGCSKQTIRNRYLARAELDFKKGQYDRAEAGYIALLRMAPLDQVSISRLGQIYCLEGRLSQAFLFLNKAVELNPADTEARLRLGLTCLAFHRTKDAWEAGVRVLQQQPENREALLLLAGATSTNLVPKTLQELEKLPASVRNGTGGHLLLGTLATVQGDQARAQAEFKQALALDPKCAEAHLGLAQVWLMRQDLKQAEPDLKSAAELAPFRSTLRLQYASFKLKTGAPDEAKRLVREITSQAPDYVPAWMFLAQAAAAERKFDECAPALKEALDRDPQNFDALILQGGVLLGKGDGTNAAAHFERMAKSYPREPQVLYNLALACLLNQEVSKAVVNLNQAVSLRPSFLEASLLLAEINLRQGAPEEAIAALTGLVRQYPQLLRAYLLLANAYLMRKDPDRAIAVYRQMQTLFPKEPQIPVLMGVILVQRNQLALARRAFEQALELNPGYLAAFEKLVELDLAEKNPSQALARVKSRIDQTPGVADLWVLLAQVHITQALNITAQEQKAGGKTYRLGDPKLRIADTPAALHDVEAAETALLKALSLNPNLRAAYLLLSQVYVSSNRHQQALDRLNAVVAKTNDVPALMQIGMIQEALNHYPAARDAYERLLSSTPNFAAALNNLAYLYAEHFGEVNKAYQMAEKARQLLPYDPYSADTLGWVLYRRGEFSHGIGLLQESVLKMPWDPEVQLHLGMTHYQLGQEEAARVALQQAVGSPKEFPNKDEGRHRLAVLAIDVNTAGVDRLPEVEKLLRESPNDPGALIRLGAIQERAGTFDQALKAYQSALEQSPQNAQVLLRLARLYADHLHQRPKALDLAKEAHAHAPQDPFIAQTLGHLVYETGDYPWALSLLTESARKRPDDPVVLYDLAWAAYSMGDVSQAEATMRKVVQAGANLPTLAEAKRLLAMIAAARSPAVTAQTSAEVGQALAADPDYVPALMVSALADEQQAKFESAAQSYNRVLARFPSFTPACRNLAFLYYDHLRDDAKAYALATKARAALPTDTDIPRILGVLAYRRGDYGLSAQWLQESLRNRNPDAESLYYLGMAHYNLRERVQSKQALLRSLDLHLQTNLAATAQRVLAELR